MRPYYERDGITIYHGDAADYLPFTDATVCITDPPYGTSKYNTDVALTPKVLQTLMGAFRVSAIFGYPELIVRWCIEAGRAPDEWVTWAPSNRLGTPHATKLPRQCESIAIFGKFGGANKVLRPRVRNSIGMAMARKRGLSTTEARETDFWQDPSPGWAYNHTQRLHPNEKPVSVCGKLLVLCAEPGDLIIDPFMGSGSVIIAAKKANYRAIGIEIEERYCEIAAKRLSQGVLELV